eukprot:6441522-Prorocentrum_lima.AAC.1
MALRREVACRRVAGWFIGGARCSCPGPITGHSIAHAPAAVRSNGPMNPWYPGLQALTGSTMLGG